MVKRGLYHCWSVFSTSTIILPTPQGLWPSMVMVVNPTIQYVLLEWLAARILAVKRLAARRRLAAAAPASAASIAASALPNAAANSAAAVAAAALPIAAAAGDGAPGPLVGSVGAAAVVVTQVLRLSASEMFLASAVAKVGATLATYPLQVVKNRLQVRRGTR